MDCSRGKYLVQLALKAQTPDSEVQTRIGSNVKVIDKNNNHKPNISDDPDISCQESDIDDTDVDNSIQDPKHKLGQHADDSVQDPNYEHKQDANDSIQDPDYEPEHDADDSIQDPDYEPEQDADDSIQDPDYEPEQEADNASNNDDALNEPDLSVDHEEIVDNTSDEGTLKRKDTSHWKENQAKRLRMEGKAYKGMKKVDGKWDLHVDRSGRILLPKDCSKRCDKTKQCQQISEDERKVIFERFWSMNWDQRKINVNSLVEIEPPKETSVDSRRNRTYKYYLRRKNERLSVCKNMFLSTLGIGEKSVNTWVESSTSGLPEKKKDSGKHNSTIN